MDAPCLYCKSRVLGCHSKCEQYKLFKSELETRNKMIKKSKDKINDANSYVFNMIEIKSKPRRDKRKNKLN